MCGESEININEKGHLAFNLYLGYLPNESDNICVHNFTAKANLTLC